VQEAELVAFRVRVDLEPLVTGLPHVCSPRAEAKQPVDLGIVMPRQVS
jgi:hypothetical protein